MLKKSIWTDRGRLNKEFIIKAKAMKNEAKALMKLAKTSKDIKLLKKQLRRFEANGCRSCHTLYRGEKKQD